MKFVLVASVAVIFAALWRAREAAGGEYTWPDGSELTCLKVPSRSEGLEGVCARSLEGYARWLETVLIPELEGTKSHMSIFGFRYSRCNDGVCYEEIGWGRELSECRMAMPMYNKVLYTYECYTDREQQYYVKSCLELTKLLVAEIRAMPQDGWIKRLF